MEGCSPSAHRQSERSGPLNVEGSSDPAYRAELCQSVIDGWADAIERITGSWEVRKPSATAAQSIASLVGIHAGYGTDSTRAAYAAKFAEYLQYQRAGRAWPKRVPNPHIGHGLRWISERLDEMRCEVAAQERLLVDGGDDSDLALYRSDAWQTLHEQRASGSPDPTW